MPDHAVSLYEQDFYAWANEQAALLRSGNLSAADIDHIAKEIDSLGRTEKRELVSRLAVLLAHLLKWQYQPERRGRLWQAAIRTQRLEVHDHLADNPSLTARLTEAVCSAYERATIAASAETGIEESAFPAACPWIFEQIMDSQFWPDGGVT